MFISYVIAPGQNDAYLARCIESLYGQSEDDFEIVLAGWQFGQAQQYVQEQLEKRTNFKVIEECPEYDRLAAAAKLVDPQAQYVQLVAESTVAVPHALRTLKEGAGGAQLLLPATIIKTAEGFTRRYQRSWEDETQAGGLDAFAYCFSKELFDRYADNLTGAPEDVETLIDILLSSGTSLAFIEQVCYYIALPEVTRPTIAEDDYDKLLVISHNVGSEALASVRVKLFTKYIHRFLQVLDSGEVPYTEQCKAYETLVRFGEQAGDNFTLQKIFSLNTGVPAADMQHLDLEAYRTLRSELFRLSDTESSVAAVTDIVDHSNQRYAENVRRIENSVKTLSKECSGESVELRKLRDEIAAMTANMHFLMQNMEQGNFTAGSGAPVGFQDPVNEVPYLFATGKLGLKVVFRSFNGWLRYKFSRKK
ncbi:MAG: hypothetical protein IJ055_01960 [Oscillospiraceae bacterium]|nr:hypothetical protein [Oscillospiraceae bacterium]